MCPILMKTRREFLGHGPALALAVALAPGALAAPVKVNAIRARHRARMVPLHELNCATFTPLVNSCFKIDPDGRKARTFILSEVREEPITETTEGSSLETFALLFWDASTATLPQRTYQIRHASIGDFSLFLVPVSRAPEGQYYEAVFNRLSR